MFFNIKYIFLVGIEPIDNTCDESQMYQNDLNIKYFISCSPRIHVRCVKIKRNIILIFFRKSLNTGRL